MNSPATATATILIVDDDINQQRLLQMSLEPEGYTTLTALNGFEALTLIATQVPDLILLDIMMPEMNGYELTQKLKADPATANIPIIMVTGNEDHATCLASLNAGAEEFLTKPVDRIEVLLRVRNLLRLKAFDDFLQIHSQVLEEQVQSRIADLQRFRTMMDATADAIYLVNRTTMKFIEANAATCKMLGYTREELLELGPSELGMTSLENLEAIYDAIIDGGPNVLAETQIQHKDGSITAVEIHRQAKRYGEDWVLVGIVRDITERQKTDQRLHYLAHYDGLTGLPNRTLFFDTLTRALAQAPQSDWLIAVLFVDIDHFKTVNDAYGHAAGDELLIQFSNRLVSCVRIRDTIGRLGGDEFALILVMEGKQHQAASVAEKIQEVMRMPFNLQGREVNVTASIGITVYPDDASDAEMLIGHADSAMYQAKQAGRDNYRFFTAQMNIELLERIEMEVALRKAIQNNEFVLHYQPKVDLKSGCISGLEALLRWTRPGHGLVSPLDFIPLLEETGLIIDVGNWIIATACKQIGAWMQSSIGSVKISVNVSARQFIEGDLQANITQTLAANNIPPDLLELELTEGTLMVNTARTIPILENLKAVGVQISIDDFGTGYSSLAYLQRFPIDKLKIDIAFIRHITRNPESAAIALAIIRMAHTLKLEVIAEGVETAEQLSFLRQHGCDHIQGYYFSKPQPVDAIELMLHEEKRLALPSRKGGKEVKTLTVA